MAEGILGDIVAHKQDEIARRLDGVSLDALRDRARPTERSLRGAMAEPGARFILEIKKASPSLGVIAVSAEPATLARHYAGVADGLSVLTDTRFFGGSLDDLRSARAHFQGPILAKDFFVDPRQVPEARIAGADAVLVMLSVLDDAEARAMLAEARRHGMDALVEVHDEGEMDRARALGAALIGINNRDLRDLSIDLSTTERLAPLAADAVLISESGIVRRRDVDRLAGCVDGFLVGSTLMRSSDPADAARELVFGRIKTCGLRTAADIEAARAAAYAGIVFVPESPRHVAVGEAGALVRLARWFGIRSAGVFANAPIADVAAIVREVRLDVVQLHGTESSSDVVELGRVLPDNVEIWTASSVSGSIPPCRGGDRTLFDHGRGGSGRTFDWSLLDGHASLHRAVIAGGIDVGNAASARALGGYAIDVGSSLDDRPGIKSPDKIAALFDALRSDSRREQTRCA